MIGGSSENPAGDIALAAPKNFTPALSSTAMTRPRIAGTALQARTARNSSVEGSTADQAPHPAQDQCIQIKKENAYHGAACEEAEPGAPAGHAVQEPEAECLEEQQPRLCQAPRAARPNAEALLPEYDRWFAAGLARCSSMAIESRCLASLS